MNILQSFKRTKYTLLTICLLQSSLTSPHQVDAAPDVDPYDRISVDVLKSPICQLNLSSQNLVALTTLDRKFRQIGLELIHERVEKWIGIEERLKIAKKSGEADPQVRALKYMKHVLYSFEIDLPRITKLEDRTPKTFLDLFDPFDSRYFIWPDNSEHLKRWNLETGRAELISENFDGEHSHYLNWRADTILSRKGDEIWLVWRANHKDSEWQETLIGSHDSLKSMGASEYNSRRIVTLNEEKQIKVWDLSSWPKVSEFSSKVLEVSSGRQVFSYRINDPFHDDRILIRTQNDSFEYRDLTSGQLLGNMDPVPDTRIFKYFFHPTQAGVFISMYKNGMLRIYDLVKKEVVKVFHASDVSINDIWNHTDSFTRFVLPNNSRTELTIFETVKPYREIATIKFDQPIASLKRYTGTNGNYFYTRMENDNKIQLWSMNSGALLRNISVNRNSIPAYFGHHPHAPLIESEFGKPEWVVHSFFHPNNPNILLNDRHGELVIKDYWHKARELVEGMHLELE